MNVFVCDNHPGKAARALADRHVVKMVLESAQLLSTVAHLKGIHFLGQYKATHSHHPCVVAMLENHDYLVWVAQHSVSLLLEYAIRFNKRHQSTTTITNAIIALDLYVGDLTELNSEQLERFPKAVFDEFKLLPVTEAYRFHLKKKYLELWKPNQAKWTNRKKPEWL